MPAVREGAVVKWLGMLGQALREGVQLEVAKMGRMWHARQWGWLAGMLGIYGVLLYCVGVLIWDWL